MANLCLFYPSAFLARTYDPLRYKCVQFDQFLERDELVGLIESALAQPLSRVTWNAPSSGPEDEAWYWAAPMLLDAADDYGATSQWWLSESLASDWSDEDEGEERSGWQEHIEEAMRVVRGERKLGRVPADLAKVLAQIAAASPAVAALRALGRVGGGAGTYIDPKRRLQAGRIAFAFRTLFNVPEVIGLIRGRNNAEPYWLRVLEYCVDGNLQSVLDEFAHMLRESEVSLDTPHDEASESLAETIASAVSLRVAQPGVDRIVLSASGQLITIDNQRVRTRFAMRFGDEQAEEGSETFRADQVRKAFNSPFWPFVLVTTSIGQEGLDFHPYCHAVVHWNLPSNPVDLEQREGRVHRYKGHAVRRNIATTFGRELMPESGDDPWRTMFAAAAAGDTSLGLRPYWVYPIESGEAIERHVPALPLSRESHRLPALRRSLAVYRMVFGQPRQDDLVAYLLSRIPKEQLAAKLNLVRIDVSPHL